MLNYQSIVIIIIIMSFPDYVLGDFPIICHYAQH